MANLDTIRASGSTDQRTDLITVVLGLWMMIGLFLDGYAHTNIIDELESFLTPWHAVFYSGFLATAGWIALTIYRRIEPGSSWIDAIPPGYGLAAVGIGIFAVGGVGDAIWHTIWGIEAGVDALLSPTHLFLFLGILLIMTTPLRTSALRRGDGSLAGLDRASVTLSVTLTTSLLAFFFMYVWAPARSFYAQQFFDAASGEGEFYVAYGIASIMVSNAILLGPLVAVLTRFRPPLGMVTISWVVGNGLTAAAFDMELGKSLLLGLAGGVTADLLIRALRAGPHRRLASLAVLTIAPIVGWTSYFVVIGNSGALTWPLELTGGAVVFAALTGFGLGVLAFPAQRTRSH